MCAYSTLSTQARKHNCCSLLMASTRELARMVLRRSQFWQLQSPMKKTTVYSRSLSTLAGIVSLRVARDMANLLGVTASLKASLESSLFTLTVSATELVAVAVPGHFKGHRL